VDIKGLSRRATSFLGKYRYVLLIILIGVVLMSMPSFSGEKSKEEAEQTKATVQTNLAKELEEILKLIDGAGDVKVILTVAESEKTQYQYNEDKTGGEKDTYDRDTVIVTGSDREQSGLITGVRGPEYRGAVVVCEGADRPSVKLSIMEAVAAVTGLGMDRISVLKMK